METKLQELKICLDWAEKQLKDVSGYKSSKPEQYQKVEKLISALNETMAEEIYKFAKSNLNKNESPTEPM